MAADTKKKKFYFSHDYDAKDDPKLANAMMEMGAEVAYGSFFLLLSYLYSNDGYLEIDKLKTYAYALRMDINNMTRIVNDFGLFEIKDGRFYNKSALKRLELVKEKSDKNRENIKKRWEEKSNTKGIENATEAPYEPMQVATESLDNSVVVSVPTYLGEIGITAKYFKECVGNIAREDVGKAIEKIKKAIEIENGRGSATDENQFLLYVKSTYNRI